MPTITLDNIRLYIPKSGASLKRPGVKMQNLKGHSRDRNFKESATTDPIPMKQTDS